MFTVTILYLPLSVERETVPVLPAGHGMRAGKGDYGVACGAL